MVEVRYCERTIVNEIPINFNTLLEVSNFELTIKDRHEFNLHAFKFLDYDGIFYASMRNVCSIERIKQNERNE